MTFEPFRELSPEIVPVLAVKTGKSPFNHPFFKLLTEEDRKSLKVALEAFNPEIHSYRFIVLPSGKRCMAFSFGETAKFNHRKAILAIRRVIQTAKAERVKRLAVTLKDFETKLVFGTELAELFAAQAEMANFEFNRYKEKPKGGWPIVERMFVQSELPLPAFEQAFARGTIIGEEINKARALANTPGGDMTPQRLAEAAELSAREYGLTIKILGEEEMTRLGMGGVLGVARGSSEKPRFIILEYKNGRKGERPIALVGKGVTFDTGGLNLKPSDHIYEMHMDMSGGAAVIHTMTALARLGVKKNIVGLIPAVENMPSGSSYRPGDVLKTMSGKTIEVLDTDAEGRIILSDALTYAQKKYNARLVIDIATLTGAAHVALGNRASAVFSTEEKHAKTLQEIGERTGDFVWPLPLWEEYENDIKGTFGDLANLGKNRYGGAITAAVFLWQFIKKTENKGHKQNDKKRQPDSPDWIHLDIAPRMTAIDGEFLAKGAAGASIYLITTFLRK